MAWISDKKIEEAIKKLGYEYPTLNWKINSDLSSGKNDLVIQWPGGDAEEIIIHVFNGKSFREDFHRQDFFFSYFAYQGNFNVLSAKFNNQTTIQEGTCYIGHPYSSLALKRNFDEDCTIIGVLIKKETFFHDYLSILSTDTEMLRFLLEPNKKSYAEEYVHLHISEDSPIWPLLGLMTYEYAYKTEDNQKILKAMYMSLVLYLSSEYKRQVLKSGRSLSERIIEYIETNLDTVTLASISANFGYHPVHVSRLLPEKTGRNFSALVMEARMNRAKLLLTHTDLSIENIAAMLGYSNCSNFYKAFKNYYGTSPRQL